MAASDHLGLQFQHSEIDYHGDPMHRLTAHLPGQAEPVGEMKWFTQPRHDEGFLQYDAGEISRLRVDDGHRRQGIATGLWNEGQKYDPAPRHSPYRTDEGDAFARKMGGPLPDADPDTGRRTYR
jgi:GNAT superfamily N-acetyltransferase